jgi:hypothetical protein
MVTVATVVVLVETVGGVAFDDVLVVGAGRLVVVDADEDVLAVAIAWLVVIGVVSLGIGEKSDVPTDEGTRASEVESSEVASGAVAMVDIVAAVAVGVAVAVDVAVGHGKPGMPS